MGALNCTLVRSANVSYPLGNFSGRFDYAQRHAQRHACDTLRARSLSIVEMPWRSCTWRFDYAQRH